MQGRRVDTHGGGQHTRRDTMPVRLVIDGEEVTASRHDLLMPLLSRMGIELPSLCYRPDLTPYGSCRLCLVQVDRGSRSAIVTACNYPVEDGERIITSSPSLTRLRRLVAGLHLARCPGEPEVRRIAASLGATGAGLKGQDEDCVLCGLCERVCSEIVGARALGFGGRGGGRTLGAAFVEAPPECIGCGACSHVCPTGAIRMDAAALERMRRLPGSARWCRHALTGLYPGAICSHSFECSTCEVDQRLREASAGHPALAAGETPERFRLLGWWSRTRASDGPEASK